MKNFEKPQMEIVEFEAEDIVTTSSTSCSPYSVPLCKGDKNTEEGDAGGAW